MFAVLIAVHLSHLCHVMGIYIMMTVLTTGMYACIVTGRSHGDGKWWCHLHR